MIEVVEKKIITSLVLLSLVVILIGVVSPASAEITYTVTLELDETEAYPSQEVMIKASFVSSYPESEAGVWVFLDEFPDVIFETSGLMEDISTPCLLPVGVIDEAGVVYDFAETTITVPLETYENTHEGTYDVYTSNLVESNKVSLEILPVEEKLTIRLDSDEASPGEDVTFTVTYTLLTPGVVLERPLSEVRVETNLTDGALSQSISLGEVASGIEITVYSDTIPISPDAEAGEYVVKVVAGPPSLESEVNLKVEASKLSVTLSTDKQTYQSGDSFIVSGFVTDEKNNPVTDATVEITITEPGGGIKHGTETTDGEGEYEWQTSWEEPVPSGDYTIRVTAVKENYEDGSSDPITVNIPQPEPQQELEPDESSENYDTGGTDTYTRTLLQSGVSAGAGIGLVEFFRRFLDKSPKGPATSSDLTSLKEKMKKLPPQPEQPQTGAVQSEEVMRLPTEDSTYRRRIYQHHKAQRRARAKRKIGEDISFERQRKARKWTPKQEMEAIQAAKPKWYKEYQEEIIAAARARKLIRYKLSNKSYRELYKALPESEKNVFDSWNRWGDSWMRRHGAGKVGKMREGRAAQFMAVTGTRA